eukprot:Phypoly_transcript_14287.p1 GENE.Phypoly_transcript_14287~~Phypoly_transcript_14287.p1  ORF type:complete len:302 (+),score=25.25 Phypoly_transcript_14287:69-974(+)
MFVLGVLSLFLVSIYAQCPAWSYDETSPNGPAHWGELCPAYANCLLSQQQSPIDLVHNVQNFDTHHLQHQYHVITNFRFGIIDHAYEALNFTTDNTLSLFGQGPYILREFHFHSPSEHHVNGVQYPLEVHFVHTDSAGNVAVLGFFYEASATPKKDSFLSTLAQFLPAVSVPGVFIDVPTLDLKTQVNTESGFYHYEGSSTTPPCIPNIQFYISRTPIATDSAILAQFASLKNARPIQPLNNRNVTVYSPSSQRSIPPVKLAFALSAGGAGLGLAFLARYAFTKFGKSKEERDVELSLLPK